MQTWDAFYPDVLPDVPECPYPTVDHALRRAAQRFCDATEVWRVWLDPVTTEEDVTEYTLELPSKAELVRMIRATLDTDEIRVYSADQLPAGWQDGIAPDGTGIYTPDRKLLQLLPAQSADLTLLVEASVKPANDAVGIENFLFDQYVATIAAGAKALLMAQPKKDWTDMEAAAVNATLFQGDIDRLAGQVLRGFSSAAPRVRASFM